MHIKRYLPVVSVALALGAFGIAAHAESPDDMSFSGMFKADRIDKNKDKMISKAEFMDQMGKVWDMKAKEMKVKGGKMSEADFQQIMMYFKAGG